MARILVDADKCMGHGRCFAFAPHLIRLTEDGFATPATPTLLDGQEDDAREAARGCPESAITVSA
jgi:ferredoxin